MKYALDSISGGSRVRGDVHVDGEVEARDEAVDRGRQTAARQDRREDPVGQLAQLGVALLRVIERLGEQRRRLRRAPRAALAARASA